MTKHNKGSAPEIAWIGRPLKDSPERPKFAAAFNELLRAKGKTHRELASDLFGRNPKTKQPHNMSVVNGWQSGNKFPNPANAAKIAKYFGEPLARLLTPAGPIPDHPATRAASHKKNPVAPPPPPLELPKDAEPLTFSLVDFKSDNRFATCNVSGVTDIDTGLAIVALILRKRTRQ
jgi:transcriptional regulator with XRE-family HTH domain